MRKRSSPSAPAPQSARKLPAAALERWRLVDAEPFQLVPWTMRNPGVGYFHCHDVLEVGLCHLGHSIFLIGERSHAVAAGEVVVIPPLAPHSAYAVDGPSQWSYLFVNTHRLLGMHDEPLLHQPGHGVHLSPRSQARLCATAQELIAEVRDRRPWWRSAAAMLVGELLVGTQRLQEHAGPLPGNRSMAGMERIAPALRLITRSFAEPLTMRQLARACGMSPSHLRRSFQDQLGTSPRDHLLAHRIEIAAGRLISGDQPIGDIALAAGFPSLSSFHRQFQRRHGCTPRDLRLRHHQRA